MALSRADEVPRRPAKRTLGSVGNANKLWGLWLVAACRGQFPISWGRRPPQPECGVRGRAPGVLGLGSGVPFHRKRNRPQERRLADGSGRAPRVRATGLRVVCADSHRFDAPQGGNHVLPWGAGPVPVGFGEFAVAARPGLGDLYEHILTVTR